MLEVKAKLLAAQAQAVEEERRGNKALLAAKQAEIDLLRFELHQMTSRANKLTEVARRWDGRGARGDVHVGSHAHANTHCVCISHTHAHTHTHARTRRLAAAFHDQKHRRQQAALFVQAFYAWRQRAIVERQRRQRRARAELWYTQVRVRVWVWMCVGWGWLRGEGKGRARPGVRAVGAAGSAGVEAAQ